jgi:hypothetical protein
MAQDHAATPMREEKRRCLTERGGKEVVKEERKRKEEEARSSSLSRGRLSYPLTALNTTKDPVQSSQVSHMFTRHIFDGIRQHQPDVANDWAISTACQLITAKGERVAQCFKPERKKACFRNPEAVLHGRPSLTSRGSRHPTWTQVPRHPSWAHHQPDNYYVGLRFLSLQVRKGSTRASKQTKCPLRKHLFLQSRLFIPSVIEVCD